MAKRRKKIGKAVVRRRKSSNKRYVGAANVSELASIIGGMIVSKLVVKAASKVLPKVLDAPLNKGIAQIVLGVVAKPIAGALNLKSPIFDGLSKGAIIGGGFELAKSLLPAALGANDDEGDVIVVSGLDEINGVDEIGQMDVIGGDSEIDEINGFDDYGY